MAITAIHRTTAPAAPLDAGRRGDGQRRRPAQDRFLKLLVAQMQNQDPLNPMDNAQVTSQMAQINTVSGIEKLNTHGAGPVEPVRADAGAAGRRAGRAAT